METEKEKEYKRLKYQKNKEALKKKSRDYYHLHNKESQDRKKRWYKKHPEKLRAKRKARRW